MASFFFIQMQFAFLAYALVAGAFLAFSDVIMRSLSLTGGVGGVEAMQVINREVFRRVFMALFLGMAAVSLVVAGYSSISLTKACFNGAPISSGDDGSRADARSGTVQLALAKGHSGWSGLVLLCLRPPSRHCALVRLRPKRKENTKFSLAASLHG